MRAIPLLIASTLGMIAMNSVASASNNPYVGTWKMISAEITQNGKSQPAFGKRPSGLLTFTTDMHFVEVLMDADTPRFASNKQDQGTDEENRAVVTKTIGIFGTYTVNQAGEFTGDRVEGCTFPNWIGDVRTKKDITVIVDGNTMNETFHRPDGSSIDISWQRVRT
jgi:Lipocalin-like domain